MWNDEHEVLKAHQLDIVGNLFGIRFAIRRDNEGAPINRIVELYIEDDENYLWQCCFHEYWLEDLKTVIEQALKDKLEHRTGNTESSTV